MILEGIITTVNVDGHVNISPMGPIVDESMRTCTLRPYRTSTTYENLKRTGQGVFHVTDDVLLLARSAIDRLDSLPPTEPLPLGPLGESGGWILSDACRWYALRVRELDDREPRTTIVADVVASGRRRDFFGLNRAKHAVVEAAILATRTELLPIDEILAQYRSLRVLVEKTGGPAEHEAFELLEDYVRAAAGPRAVG